MTALPTQPKFDEEPKTHNDSISVVFENHEKSRTNQDQHMKLDDCAEASESQQTNNDFQEQISQKIHQNCELEQERDAPKKPTLSSSTPPYEARLP